MTQSPPGPPEGPPPWGHYPQPNPQPKRGRGWEIFGGVVVGGFAAILVPLVVIAIVADSGSEFGAVEVVLGLALVPILGIGLLFAKASRPWGTGILIGWAVAVIVIGGSCVALLASLDGSL